MTRRALLRRAGTVAAAAIVPAGLPGRGLASVGLIIDGLPAIQAAQSIPVKAEHDFSMLGFGSKGSGQLEYRVSSDGAAWTPWAPIRGLVPTGEGPDAASYEATRTPSGVTQPAWVGRARWLQVRGTDPAQVRVHLVPAAATSASARKRSVIESETDATGPHTTPTRPPIVTRAEWGADETLRRGDPRYAAAARFAVIHHTATAIRYTEQDVPAILRGIYRYHTETLGWDDIGYNFVVDRFGRVFEGRYGGIEEAVIGAHASGHNDGSIGIAALGCFDADTCQGSYVDPAVVAALDAAVAWKFALHGIDPYGTTREGTRELPTIVGHRDVGSTVCPGSGLFRYVRGDDPMAPRVWRGIHGFRDVPPSSPFADAIAWAVAAGITKGTNPPANDLFRPQEPVTREQMAAFLARAFALTDDQHPGFADVPPGSLFDRDIRLVARAGITSGCTPTLFCPKDHVTRAQMAAFLHRAFIS